MDYIYQFLDELNDEPTSLEDATRKFQRDYIRVVLEIFKNPVDTAGVLDIARESLYRKCRALDISVAEQLQDSNKVASHD